MLKNKALVMMIAVVILLVSLTVPVFADSENSETNPSEPGDYCVIDSHLHYVDFLQETDGFEALVKKLDETNVSHAVICGLPMAKEWDEHATKKPDYYLSNDARCYYYSATDFILLEDYLAQPEEIRDRFFPFVCGINPNDRSSADHIRRLLQMYPDEIYGIGEVMTHHDDLTALTYGEAPRADHPAYLAIFDLAAEYGLPVLLHHNIGPSGMDDPIYLEEMKKALAYNRDTVIIWAHTGISRRVEDSKHIEIVEQMLEDNPNLYYDISWVVFDDYIDKSEETLDEWAELIMKYPDRFMIGSDKVGHWDGYEKDIYKYYTLIDRLDNQTKEMLTRTNILELIHVDPETMERIIEQQDAA